MSAQIGRKPEELMMQLSDRLRLQAKGELASIPLPWPQLDRLFGGLGPGETTILAGTEGSSKSYVALSILLWVRLFSKKWIYLPIEETASYWLQRMLAILANDWKVTSKRRDDANHISKTIGLFTEEIAQIQEGLCENPRKPVRTDNGLISVGLPWKRMLDFIKQASETHQLIVVDPITMIDFNKGEVDEQYLPEWEGQRDFVNDAISVIGASKCHLIMVMHMNKTGDHVQGSSRFTQIVQNVILMKKHAEKCSEVMTYNKVAAISEKQDSWHKRTMFLEKVRNGPGTGISLAYDFDEKGPQVCEKGIIRK